ncbi:MAG: FAD-dependent oxidoreductase [Pirellulales bacterium]
MRNFRIVVAALLICSTTTSRADEPSRECDLLIVGGSESAVAAAVQAARLGVGRIILANDCDWLGGQFTAEGLGAVDEWTKFGDSRAPFPRSGLFLEIMQMIETDMQRKYGHARPGNCFCAWTTCEPRDTERLFRKLVEPYLKTGGGPLEILDWVEPERVVVENGRVTEVVFVGAGPNSSTQPLHIKAKLTVDASDWGDVVRLSGAKYFCGPDLKERFDEPSAPVSYAEIGHNEINPLTYNLVLRESDRPTIIPKPEGYDKSRYFAATIATREEFQKLGWPQAAMKPFAAAWRDTTLPKGPYSESPTVYHHRRLVDRRHFNLAPGTEAVLVNWPLQDYPTDRYPQRVVDELEAAESGASQKNLAEMSPKLRRIVFADAKRHSLGLLHHLQTTVAERDLAAGGGKPIVTFRDLKLTDEFGTSDGLPLKPYVREGLRTDCMYVVREQDVRDVDGVQCWAA